MTMSEPNPVQARRLTRLLIPGLLAIVGACASPSRDLPKDSPPEVRSELIRGDAGDLVLFQEVLVHAPVSEVWDAYTTDEGWRSWASPVVSIDLRIGGMIQTHYGQGAAIGDPGTNTLHILNYVPNRLLTLQAEVEERWPAIMKEDAHTLMNVIVFEDLGGAQTRIQSYGTGYRDTDAYGELLDFFIPANEGLFGVLKSKLEGPK